jgi:hypothetical protein
VRTVTRAAVVTALLAVALTWSFWGAVAPAEAASAKAEGDNPAPFINALSPSAAAIGGPAFVLTVDGVGFVPGSEVRWNGEPRPTTYLSAGQLAAQIDAADITVAQTASLTVFNPLPGGGLSSAVPFVVQAPNPVPDVTGLSPAQAMVGDDAFGITVIGNGFVPGSTVLWNGEDRTSGYLNEFMLAATIRASDLAAAGTAFVSVLNPAPGGGPSASARVFTIVYPAPTLALLEPVFVWAGGPGFTLAVAGGRFTPVSVVQWAGVDRPTVYVSSGRLEAQISAAEVARAGAPSVRVFTPGPGGGLSAPLFAEVRDDDIPPVTVVSGLKATWHRATTTFTLVATDVGLGVQCTFYRFGQSDEAKIGTRVTVRAPINHSNDGLHTVQYYSVDKVLNWEYPVKQVQVGIDTKPPVTSVAGASVARGGTLRPKYRVDDATSPRARDARLAVSNLTGQVVLRCDLGRPVTRTWHTGAALRVTLPRGTYRMRAYAHDLAGNPQSATKSGTLTVY